MGESLKKRISHARILLMVKHYTDAVFSVLSTLCFHKSQPSVSLLRMSRCSYTHCHAPCTRVRNSSSFSFSTSSQILPPPVYSAAPRLHPSSFKCFFMWFCRFVSTYYLFFSSASSNGIPLSLSSCPQRMPLLLGVLA